MRTKKPSALSRMQVYSDALLLTDALERHDVGTFGDIETDTLVDLHTVLSDVQRSADDLRKEVADILAGRLHRDQSVGSLAPSSGLHAVNDHSRKWRSSPNRSVNASNSPILWCRVRFSSVQ